MHHWLIFLPVQCFVVLLLQVDMLLHVKRRGFFALEGARAREHRLACILDCGHGASAVVVAISYLVDFVDIVFVRLTAEDEPACDVLCSSTSMSSRDIEETYMNQQPFIDRLCSCPCRLRKYVAAVRSVFSSSGGVGFDYRTERPCIDRLKLDDFVKRKDGLVGREVRANYHVTRYERWQQLRCFKLYIEVEVEEEIQDEALRVYLGT